MNSVPRNLLEDNEATSTNNTDFWRQPQRLAQTKKRHLNIETPRINIQDN
jgi:hypothetical protein